MAKELLFSITKKDFDIHYFSGTGAGGQNRNKHQNCVRMTHRDSGVSATGQNSRDKIQNERDAFNAITKSIKFKMWHQQRVAEILERKTLEQKIDESLAEKNLKIEVLKDGKWEPMEPETAV